MTIDDSVSTAEHVILQAIGGKRKSKALICEACNKHFDKAIDEPFSKALSAFTQIVNPPRERMLRQVLRIRDNAGLEYDLAPGGAFRLRIQEMSPGVWAADADDETRLLHRLDAMRRRHALNADHPTPSIISRTLQPGPWQFSISIDNFIAVRALMKWVIHLLGLYVIRSDIERTEELLSERSFVYSGAAPIPLSGYLERSIIPYSIGALEHYVLIAQSPDGTVYWEASAYGSAIAAAGRTVGIRKRFEPVMYRVDPVTGTHSTERPSIDVPNDRCWWVPKYNAACSERLHASAKNVEALMNGRRIVDECIANSLPPEGVVTHEHLHALAKCLTNKGLGAIMRARTTK